MPATICDHDQTLLTRAALEPLPEAERAELDDRLAVCGACRERLAEYRALVAGLHELLPARTPAFTPASEASDGIPAHPRAARPLRERLADAREWDAERRISPLPVVRERRVVTLVGTVAALLLLALFLGSFWSFGPGRLGFGTPARPSLGRVGLPSVDTTLGAAPVACAGAPAPQTDTQGIGGAIGVAPLWIGGFVGANATLLAGGTPAPYGWSGKVVTHLDSAFSGTITIRGTNLRNNTPLWFQLAGATTTSPAYSQSAGAYRQSAGANETGYIFIPTAGCYTLTVTWAAGSWTFTFAAGSALPTSVGKMPAWCPNQPAPAPLAAGLPPVIGQLPLWMTANGAHASYQLDLSGDGVPVTFFVSNTFAQTVSVRGRNTATGAPVGFVAPPNPPATVLALNNSYVRSPGAYTEWQGRAYFPTAGCYALTATWPGGSWTFDVAAGS